MRSGVWWTASRWRLSAGRGHPPRPARGRGRRPRRSPDRLAALCRPPRPLAVGSLVHPDLVNACRDRLRARYGGGWWTSGGSRGDRASRGGRRRGDHRHPDALELAVDRLSPDDGADRPALRRRPTVPAIAPVIGIPQGTVKSRLHHAFGASGRRSRWRSDERDAGRGRGAPGPTRASSATSATCRAAPPGTCPVLARERVLDVPAAGRPAAPDPRRLMVPTLGLAAALALVAIGCRSPAYGAGGTVGASPVPPRLRLLVQPDSGGTGHRRLNDSTLVPLLVVLVTITFLMLIVALGGWRRLVPAAGAVGWVAFGLYIAGADQSEPMARAGAGHGRGRDAARHRCGHLLCDGAPRPAVQLAAVLTINAPVPVRIEGLLPAATVSTTPRPAALSIDAEPNGGNLGPGRQLAAGTRPADSIQALSVVRRAGSCAVGQTSRPSEPSPTDLGFASVDSVHAPAQDVSTRPRTVRGAAPIQPGQSSSPNRAPQTRPHSPG